MGYWKRKVVYALFRLYRIRGGLDRAFDTGEFGRQEVRTPPTRTRSSLQWDTKKVEGRDVFVLKPSDQHTSRGTILYLHGGAYVFGFHDTHWRFLETLVQETGYTVVAPDYPLAPEQTFRDAYAMVKPLCQALSADESGGELILMGDSAGGGFALALAQEMHRESMVQAGKIILMCPWLDLTLDNPEIASIASEDPILTVSGLRRAGQAYAGGTDPSHRLLSPINGGIEDLGKISILIGSMDLLVADARRLKRMAEEQKVPLRYMEFADRVHNWMFFPLPGAREAVRQVVAIINETNH